MPSAPNIVESAVVEFADKGKIQLGFVLSVDPKTSKVRLINQLRREVVLAPKQILHLIAKNAGISAGLPISNISDLLTSLELRSQTLVTPSDLEELWSLNEGEETVTLDMLVGLLFTDAEARHRLAMIRALRADRIYFKETEFEVYQLRTAENVAENFLGRRQNVVRLIEGNSIKGAVADLKTGRFGDMKNRHFRVGFVDLRT